MNAAKAALEEARSQYERIQTFVKEEAATEKNLERARAAFLQARAAMRNAENGIQRAQADKRRTAQSLEEARIGLGYAKIQAPHSGRVAETPVDPGDLARPGVPLVYLESQAPLRLKALVPEDLLSYVELNSTVTVTLDAVPDPLQAEVVQIVPSADPRSHTFVVKAKLPRHEGIYSGMFGRLMIRIGTRDAVVVPHAAIQHVGQLDLVTLRSESHWITVPVVLGPAVEGGIEILSGLSGGETVALTGGRDG